MIDLYPKLKSLSRLSIGARCYLNPTFFFFYQAAFRPASDIVLLVYSDFVAFSPRGRYVSSCRVAQGRPLERVRRRMKIFGSNITTCLYEAWFEMNRISDLSFSQW